MEITIREPYFSAWKRYGWPKGIWGLGINKEHLFKALQLRENLLIHVNSLKADFECMPQTVINYCQNKRAYFTAGKNTLLYVIPNFMLDKLGGKDPLKIESDTIQKSLF